MSRGNGSSVIPVAVFLAILIIIIPVSAYTVAIYGTNAGFDPSLHPDSVVVVREIPGSTGADLDNNIDQFVQPSVDVIILGGEATFSPATAAKIEAAVAGGKILIVTFPCNRLFDNSLPASNGGTTAGGQYLEVSDPTSVVSKAVFAQLPTRFDLKGTAPDKEQAVAHAGTITVLNYDTGMPALLYGLDNGRSRYAPDDPGITPGTGCNAGHRENNDNTPENHRCCHQAANDNCDHQPYHVRRGYRNDRECDGILIPDRCQYPDRCQRELITSI